MDATPCGKKDYCKIGLELRSRHGDCTALMRLVKDAAMIEFRWVVFLTLWTLLIGPIFDLAPTPSSPGPRAKAAAVKTVKAR